MFTCRRRRAISPTPGPFRPLTAKGFAPPRQDAGRIARRHARGCSAVTQLGNIAATGGGGQDRRTPGIPRMLRAGDCCTPTTPLVPLSPAPRAGSRNRVGPSPISPSAGGPGRWRLLASATQQPRRRRSHRDGVIVATPIPPDNRQARQKARHDGVTAHSPRHDHVRKCIPNDERGFISSPRCGRDRRGAHGRRKKALSSLSSAHPRPGYDRVTRCWRLIQEPAATRSAPLASRRS